MKKTKIIFIAVGIAILVVLFRSFGLEKTIDHITTLGWKFWIIVGMFIFTHLTLSYGWKVLINHPIKPSYFYKLVLARIAGDTTSAINALGAIAGEPLKALFVKDKIPFRTGLASVVLDRTIHTASNFTLIITGVIISFFILDMPVYVKVLSLLTFTACLGIMIAILYKQKSGIAEFVIKKMPGRIVKKIMDEERWKKVRALDGEMKFIFSSRDNLRRFYISFAIHYIITMVSGILEIYLIMNFIGYDISLAHSFLVYLFALILTGAIFFMPANIGTSEGAFSIALKFLGYDPALGLTVGIIRRLRTFVWAIIGIAILLYAGLLRREVDYEEGKNI
jgi:hypothetical protein